MWSSVFARSLGSFLIFGILGSHIRDRYTPMTISWVAYTVIWQCDRGSSHRRDPSRIWLEYWLYGILRPIRSSFSSTGVHLRRSKWATNNLPFEDKEGIAHRQQNCDKIQDFGSQKVATWSSPFRWVEQKKFPLSSYSSTQEYTDRWHDLVRRSRGMSKWR